MSTLTEEDLTALLTQTADEYAVPEHGPAEVLTARATVPEPVPVVRRHWVQLSAACLAAAALITGIALWGDGPDKADVNVTKAAPGAPAGEPGAGAESGGRNLGGATTEGGTTGGSAAVGGGSVGGMTGGYANSTTGTTGGGVAQAQSAPAADTAPAAGAPVAPAPQPVKAPARVDGPATGAVAAAAPDDADGRVVKSGSIALVTEDDGVPDVLAGVHRATAAQGGYVAASTTNEYGDTPSAEVTVRVPVARFERLVAAVRALDAEVRTSTTSGKDVTAQYSDMETQLKTLRASRDRFLVILGRADTIGEILSVQQRVDAVTGQIDRLEGSRKLLASQSDLSTLTVSVSEADDPVVRVAAKRSGLSKALHDAKDGFVTGVEAIVRHSGRALVWLLALVVAAVVVRAGWKVARRRLV